MVKTENNWQTISIDLDTTIKARIGWQGLTIKEYKEDGKYYLVTGTDFENGLINWDTCHFVDKWRYTQDKNIQLKNGDVLVTKDGTIGKVGYVESLHLPATLNSGIFVVRAKDNEKIDSKFLYYILLSKIFEEFLAKLSAGSTIIHLYQKDFIYFNFKAPPSIKEQKAIANALSSIDKLIEVSEKIIAKKEAIKIGIMQKLLSGKKEDRLKGFSEEWEEKKLFEVTNLITCGIASTPNYVSENEGYPFLSSTNIKSGQIILKNLKYISKKLHKQLNKNNPLKRGDILYSRIGAIIGEASVVDIDYEFSIYVSLTHIKPKPILDSYFLMHLLNSPRYKKMAYSEVFLGGGVGNLNIEVIRKFPIYLPPLKEQQAIAKILSDMDRDIEILKQKLAKTKAIKKGMMQDLLSGKVRFKL